MQTRLLLRRLADAVATDPGTHVVAVAVVNAVATLGALAMAAVASDDDDDEVCDAYDDDDDDEGVSNEDEDAGDAVEGVWQELARIRLHSNTNKAATLAAHLWGGLGSHRTKLPVGWCVGVLPAFLRHLRTAGMRAGTLPSVSAGGRAFLFFFCWRSLRVFFLHALPAAGLRRTLFVGASSSR